MKITKKTIPAVVTYEVDLNSEEMFTICTALRQAVDGNSLEYRRVPFLQLLKQLQDGVANRGDDGEQ